MATPAQITANRLNAQSSSGPKTAEGKARCASNASTFGLFSRRHHVSPEDAAAYQQVAVALLADLRPQGGMEEMYAAEIVRISWRLRRCSVIEDRLADTAASKGESAIDAMEDSETREAQLAVDRARAHCSNLLRKATAELRHLQTERRIRLERSNCGSQGSQFGLSDSTILIRSLGRDANLQLALDKVAKVKAHNSVVASRYSSAPVTDDFLSWMDHEIAKQTQSEPVSDSETVEIAKQTQSDPLLSRTAA